MGDTPILSLVAQCLAKFKRQDARAAQRLTQPTPRRQRTPAQQAARKVYAREYHVKHRDRLNVRRRATRPSRSLSADDRQAKQSTIVSTSPTTNRS